MFNRTLLFVVKVVFLVAALSLLALPFLCGMASAAEPVAGSLERRLLDVSVAISVSFPDGVETTSYQASGTLVASDGRSATVLTCWHTLRGVPLSAATIMVEHGGRSHVASVSKADEANDVVLLSVPVNYELPVARLASQIPSIGEQVWSAGRDESGRLSVQQTKVMAVDRYDSPLNLECDGPVIAKGRSGGGLFDANGDLVGFAQCRRNDSPRTGLYVRLPAVRLLLGEANLPAAGARPARTRRVLSFGAKWCQHCQADHSFAKEAVPWLGRAGWSIGATETHRVQLVDIDNQPEMAKRFGVETIPALVVVEGDRVVERIVYRGRSDLAGVLVRHGLAHAEPAKSVSTPAPQNVQQPGGTVVIPQAPVGQTVYWTHPSSGMIDRRVRGHRR